MASRVEAALEGLAKTGHQAGDLGVDRLRVVDGQHRRHASCPEHVDGAGTAARVPWLGRKGLELVFG